MKFNKVIMNPPYDKDLHLKVTDKVLEINKPEDGCEIVSISPVSWLEDSMKDLKRGYFKKFKQLTMNLSNLKLLSVSTSCKLFNITISQDLGIYFYSVNKPQFNLKNIYKYNFIDNIIQKIISKMPNNCKSYYELEQVDGWRCETFETKSLGQAATTKNTYTADGWEFMITGDKGYYHDGFDSTGKWWTENRQKTQHTRTVGEPFAQSFKFNSELECKNFYDSTHTKFFINYVYLLKMNMSVVQIMPFLPYMEDYSHVWTDEDYCKFFGLNEEESKFMCRTVDDYRVKDFINYEEI